MNRFEVAEEDAPVADATGNGKYVDEPGDDGEATDA